MINELVKVFLENNHFYKDNIKPGTFVLIVLKEHQKTDLLTYGQIKNLLTSKPVHTRGIKVRLISGHVGRVQILLSGPIKKITFPKNEHSQLIEDLIDGYDILTTQILNQKNKYVKDDILESDIGYFLKVIKIEHIKSDQFNIYLRKVGKINK